MSQQKKKKIQRWIEDAKMSAIYWINPEGLTADLRKNKLQQERIEEMKDYIPK